MKPSIAATVAVACIASTLCASAQTTDLQLQKAYDICERHKVNPAAAATAHMGRPTQGDMAFMLPGGPRTYEAGWEKCSEVNSAVIGARSKAQAEADAADKAFITNVIPAAPAAQ